MFLSPNAQVNPPANQFGK